MSSEQTIRGDTPRPDSDDSVEPGVISSLNKNLIQDFKKTDELVAGEKYKVFYLRKQKTQFGTRIRCFCVGFNYDLPTNFVYLLHRYNLDEIDYRNVYLHYVGRRDDTYRSIIMNLTGLPILTDDAAPAVDNNNNGGQREYPSSSSSSKRPRVQTMQSGSGNICSSGSNNQLNVVASASSSPCVASSLLFSNYIHPVTVSLNDDKWIGKRKITANKPLEQTQTTTPPITTTTVTKCRNEGPIYNSEFENDIGFNCCRICFNAEIDTALIKCGHRTFSTCAKKYVRKLCPFCRERVSKVIRTYDG